MNKTAGGNTASPLNRTQTATPIRAAQRAGTAQPARERNIQALVEFIESGIKPLGGPEAVGIELEHTVVRDDGSPVGYSDDHGIAWLLERLRAEYPQATFDEEGDILGVAREGAAVTIEPAAQVELSAGPFTRLADAQRAFEGFEELLARELSPHGIKALTLGYHPTARVDELALIPKRRYRFMDLYFKERGPYGRRMMRGSASTQVSIDYTSTADCLRKLRLAFALVPMLSLMCDNAPVFEGKPREHQLVRTDIWQHVDNDRCGLVPDVLDPSFDLRRYAEYILDTVAILIPCQQQRWCYSDRTFGDIYAARTMTRAEVEHAVSMFFTDVRLKTYIEIRPADAMPIPYVIAYAALIKGLFYAPTSLDAMDGLFADVRRDDYLAAQDALMERGYEAEVYGRPVAELCDRIVKIARDGLADEEQGFLEPLADLVARRVTLADLAERSERA